MRLTFSFFRRTLAILSCLFFFLVAQPVHAQSDFSTALDSTYTVLPSGMTKVKKIITLTNNMSTVYATRYGLELNSNLIENVAVYDRNGTLPATINQTDQKTTIGISFPDKVVGRGQARVFTVEYEDPDIAVLTGKVLEVYVPKMADPETYTEYRVTLRVPKDYGQPAISAPDTYQQREEPDYLVLDFNDDTKTNGISIIFGNEQYYQASLKYHLQNSSTNKGITQIALPPDTSFQRVVYTDLEPKPEKIEKDSDGNWIATYLLEGEQEQTVTATAYVNVFLKPQPVVPVTIPQENHTLPTQFWEVTDPTIQAMAARFNTPREIYDFVVDTLSYDYQRLDQSSSNSRLGAVGALNSPTNAVCQEYTDLFIALSRAKGIPARQATGYALTSNDRLRPLSLIRDILHAWPEYYDREQNVWHPIDPTWGSTTGGVDYFSHFDFSHIVFAYQGVSSDKPFPAGSYKLTSDPYSKDVEVELADTFPLSTPQFTVQLEPKQNPFAVTKIRYILKVNNNAGHAEYGVPIFVSPGHPLSVEENGKIIESILPFQQSGVDIVFIANEFSLQKKSVPVLISVGNQSYETNITIGGLTGLFMYALLGGVGLISLTLIGAGFALRRKK